MHPGDSLALSPKRHEWVVPRFPRKFWLAKRPEFHQLSIFITQSCFRS